ncbi:MAG: hypothetical protein QOF36_2610 [Microbacteriaceae bacterium]|jgi:hypothetical protein|nr:hypothetical protein [Microbacteriaceae bacterium]
MSHAIPMQLLMARELALHRADELYARASVRSERGRPDLGEVLRAAGDRALLDARAVTGELVFEGDGKPILLAPLDMHR